MAHEIESMMYTGATPWHGLGTMIKYAPTIEEALVASGLNWNVALKTMTLEGSSIVVPNQRAAVRDSDNKILGVVGDRYNVLQNKEAFEWFRPFLDSGLATLETAMSLRGGSRVAILAKLAGNPMVIAKGDEVEKYILLYHSHDGSLMAGAGLTPIRVVCANTLKLAQNDMRSQLIKFKHTQSLHLNLDRVREIINTSNNRFEATAEQYRMLANKGIDAFSLKKYVNTVFDTVEKEDGSNSKILEKIIPLFEKGKGNDLASIRGTYWAAYNAVTEYLGYQSGRSQDTRLNSLWLGAGSDVNQHALNTALEMIKAA